MASFGQDGTPYARFLWIYLIAPSLGGFASAMFNKYVHLPNIDVAEKKSVRGTNE